jgi:hypothetical protein
MSEQEKGQEPKEPQVDGQESAPAEAPEVSTNEEAVNGNVDEAAPEDGTSRQSDTA